MKFLAAVRSLSAYSSFLVMVLAHGMDQVVGGFDASESLNQTCVFHNVTRADLDVGVLSSGLGQSSGLPREKPQRHVFFTSSGMSLRPTKPVGADDQHAARLHLFISFHVATLSRDHIFFQGKRQCRSVL